MMMAFYLLQQVVLMAKTQIKLFLFQVDVLEIMTWPLVTMKRQIQGSGYMLQFPAQTKS
jgi:hypothetical protein